MNRVQTYFNLKINEIEFGWNNLKFIITNLMNLLIISSDKFRGL